MIFINNDVTRLLEAYKSFQIEGFNIFGIGKNDDLPHIVCVTPNRSTANALHALLEISKKAQHLLTFRDSTGAAFDNESATCFTADPDVSLNEKEPMGLRAFGTAGTSTQQVEELVDVVTSFVERKDNGSQM